MRTPILPKPSELSGKFRRPFPKAKSAWPSNNFFLATRLSSKESVLQEILRAAFAGDLDRKAGQDIVRSFARAGSIYGSKLGLVHRDWGDRFVASEIKTEHLNLDLVLFDKPKRKAIAIELKVHAEESTIQGSPQTTVYADRLAREHPRFSWLHVFVSPWGAAPRDSRWVSMHLSQPLRELESSFAGNAHECQIQQFANAMRIQFGFECPYLKAVCDDFYTLGAFFSTKKNVDWLLQTLGQSTLRARLIPALGWSVRPLRSPKQVRIKYVGGEKFAVKYDSSDSKLHCVGPSKTEVFRIPTPFSALQFNDEMISVADFIQSSV